MLAIADTLGPISSVDLTLPWTDGPATSRRARRALIRRVTTDGAYAGAHADTRHALALGLLILRAQRRDIAAQCTCGGLHHHRRTCPAVALCAGCIHED